MMEDDVVLSSFAKGRLALPSKIAKKMDISENDPFIISTEGEKIIFKKISKENLKKLK